MKIIKIMKQITLPNGRKCFCLDKISALASYREVYEDKDYLQYGLDIPENAVVFDIGANIGHFSRYVAENYPSAHVYAFEPVPQIFKVYSANIAHYPDRVHPYNLGLAEKAGEIMINYFPRLSVNSAIKPFVWNDMVEFGTNNWETFTDGYKIARIVPKKWRRFFVKLTLKILFKTIPTKCHLKPLSAIISENNLSKIDFLKIDAENYEDNVIAGINDEHWPLIQQIAMEVHQNIEGGENINKKISSLLELKGFSVKMGKENIAPGSNVFMLYAKREKK